MARRRSTTFGILRAMTQSGIADLMSQWKSMSDQFLKQWGQVYEATA